MLWFLWYSAKMRFPVGHVQDPDRLLGIVRDVFGRKLESVKARNIEIAENSLTFTGGIFRLVSNWNLLGPIDHGTIEIVASDQVITVRFRISFVQLIIVSTMLTTLMALVIASRFRGEPPLGFYIFLWFWFVGGNMAISIPRFRGFVKRCVKEALKIKR